jgi:7,8-dihydroneopterin aldolase/epimerase/oxygenase
MSTGTVRIRNAVFYAHHGVMKEEHRVGGRYEVDVAMDLDFEAAAGTDSLDLTVDYEQVYAVIRETVTENKFYLIERLAYLIARRILALSGVLEAVEVTVRKANPPVGGPCDCAEAVYRTDNRPI